MKVGQREGAVHDRGPLALPASWRRTCWGFQVTYPLLLNNCKEYIRKKTNLKKYLEWWEIVFIQGDMIIALPKEQRWREIENCRKVQLAVFEKRPKCRAKGCGRDNVNLGILNFFYLKAYNWTALPSVVGKQRWIWCLLAIMIHFEPVWEIKWYIPLSQRGEKATRKIYVSSTSVSRATCGSCRAAYLQGARSRI